MGTLTSPVSAAEPGAPRLEWGVAARPMPGETQSGDDALVLDYGGGCLLAVADGLGHGEEAADATRQALAVLRAVPQRSVLAQMRQCHEALRSTRGVVLGLAAIDYAEDTLTWVGVGNVTGVLVHTGSGGESEKEHLLCRSGVVGDQFPRLYAGMMSLAHNDLMILHTDGLHPLAVDSFTHWLQSPQKIAEGMMHAWGRSNDDALILVARYGGGRR